MAAHVYCIGWRKFTLKRGRNAASKKGNSSWCCVCECVRLFRAVRLCPAVLLSAVCFRNKLSQLMEVDTQNNSDVDFHFKNRLFLPGCTL